jgi:hypothetical protein
MRKQSLAANMAFFWPSRYFVVVWYRSVLACDMKNIMAMCHGFLLCILVFCVCGASSAAPACDAVALHADGYARSVKSVQSLPELGAWSRSHKFPVAYGQSTDKQVLMQGRCYWSVSVYADRSDRLELWHLFYVEVRGKQLLVQDPVSGAAISLQQWRSRERRRN